MAERSKESGSGSSLFGGRGSIPIVLACLGNSMDRKGLSEAT